MEKTKIGILSFAHGHAVGILHALADRDDVALMVADEDPARARQHATPLGVTVADSYQDLLAWRPDGVVVCSENAKHRELTELAAAAGAAVLCEKPLATSVADCEAMIRACETAGVGLMTAFPVRFEQPMQSLHTLVRSGQLGRILGAAGTNPGSNPGGWFNDATLAGGGAVMDHTVHVVDLFRWLLGTEPVEVYAQANRLLYPDVPVETAGTVAVKFSDGMLATVDCSWSRPRSYPTWGTVTLQLVGENGVVNVDISGRRIEAYHDAERAVTASAGMSDGGASAAPSSSRARWVPWGHNSVVPLLQEFLSAIREGRRPEPDGTDGMRATQVALAAYRSISSGQPVAI